MVVAVGKKAFYCHNTWCCAVIMYPTSIISPFLSLQKVSALNLEFRWALRRQEVKTCVAPTNDLDGSRGGSNWRTYILKVQIKRPLLKCKPKWNRKMLKRMGWGTLTIQTYLEFLKTISYWTSRLISLHIARHDWQIWWLQILAWVKKARHIMTNMHERATFSHLICNLLTCH